MFRFAARLPCGISQWVCCGECETLQKSVTLWSHFFKLAYLSNLTFYNNNHFLTEIRTIKAKSPANTEIKMIFHY